MSETENPNCLKTENFSNMNEVKANFCVSSLYIHFPIQKGKTWDGKLVSENYPKFALDKKFRTGF